MFRPWPAELDAFLVSKPSNRRYFSGFTGSSGMLLVTNKDEKFLITDFRYMEQAKEQAPDFHIVQQEPEPAATLAQLAKEYGLKDIGLEKDHITLSIYEELSKKMPGLTLWPLYNPFEHRRKIKSPGELQLIAQAVAIADAAFGQIKEIIKPGLREKEIAAELEFIMKRSGAEKHAFDTIVASGVRSSLPHGTPTDKVIQSGDFVTLDFGAVFEGYSSDITRTLIIGQPDARQREIYSIVKEAQERAIDNIRPGKKAADIDKTARDIIADYGYGSFFGHGLGHSVGLEIHEEPRFAPRDNTILQPGMVVTVEPGIYLPGWGGVRIEDMIVVGAKGCEILTRAPKDIEDMII
jgi:Xaa-Pro aminopeptidase